MRLGILWFSPHTACMLSKSTDGENKWWQTEEIFWSKNQGYRRINQGSDGSWTKIGRPKVPNIYYNTVSPFILIWISQ